MLFDKVWKNKWKSKYDWDNLNKRQKVKVLFFGKMTNGEIFLLLLFFSYLMYSSWAYKHDIAQCYQVIKNPCAYCDQQMRDATGWIINSDTNLTGKNITIINDPFIRRPYG